MPETHLSRRMLTAAAVTTAWATPAVITLTAAPSFATSGTPSLAAVYPSPTFPAYLLGTAHDLTAQATALPTGTPVVFTLDGPDTSWLTLDPDGTTPTTTRTVTTDALGTATVRLTYRTGVVPPIPTTVSLTGTAPSVVGTTPVTWTIDYRAGQPTTSQARGAIGLGVGLSAHALVHRNGRAYGWGYDRDGQTGAGITTGSPTSTVARPRVVTSTSGSSLAGKVVTHVAAGRGHSLALAADGSVHAWGSNDSVQLGLGVLDTVSRTRPVEITGTGSLAGRIVLALAAGAGHSLALDTQGRVHAWGVNGVGELGLTADFAVSPTLVPVAGSSLADRRVVAIAAAFSTSIALAEDGTLHAWGDNRAGQLGIGAATRTTRTPTAVVTAGTSLEGRTVRAIRIGGGSCLALADDGTVHAWGENSYGLLGDGTPTGRPTPGAVRVAGTSLEARTVDRIALGDTSALALATDGTLHAWGYDDAGQLGSGAPVGSRQRSDVPVQVRTAGSSLAGRTPVAIAVVGQTCLVLASDGTLHTWGESFNGLLGNGGTQPTSVPGLVDPLP